MHVAGVTLLFPFGVRLSTWLGIAAFLAIEAKRRDGVAFFAGLAWLIGFEALFEMTALAFGNEGPTGPLHSVAYLVLAAVLLPWLMRHGIRPVLWPFPIIAALWIAWMALGFPYNGHDTTSLNVPAEVLNEAAKTLWAVAYLVPLLNAKTAPQPKPGGDSPVVRPDGDGRTLLEDHQH